MKSLLLLPVLAALLTSSVSAQNTDDTNTNNNTTSSETESNRRFWQTSVPGGAYMVALDRITSISKQVYLLDGVLVVHEVTIDTVGQALARFYFVDSQNTSSTAANTAAARAKQLLEEAGRRTGTEAQNMVTKKFPDTTHAKALEYRLASVEEVNALYKSVQDAWESGRGRKFTIK